LIPENPYASAEIRGIVELIDDPNKELPKKLSQKYLGTHRRSRQSYSA
jgi:hypothetical protein